MRPPASRPPILFVCGLVAEARLVRARGTETLCSGGDVIRLEAALEARAGQGLGGAVGGLISFGVAGGLSNDAPSGTVIVADRVIDGSQRFNPNAAWADRFRKMVPAARRGAIVGVNQAVANLDDKQRLFDETGALAADMESHVVARVATRVGLPFAVLRVVSDGPRHALPPAALIGMRPDGSSDVLAVIGEIIREPRQLPALIATALDYSRAMRALKVSAQAILAEPARKDR